MRHQKVLAFITVVASTLAFAPGATALCGGIETPAGALASGDLGFVGVVESVTNLDRWATVHVEEVWSDDDLAEWVEVRGSIYGPTDPFGIFTTISSGDKSYNPGGRYLFFPTVRDGHLFDDECSAGSPWDPSLELLRPASAHPPVPGGRAGVGVAWPLVLLGATVIGGGFVLYAFRRTRTR